MNRTSRRLFLPTALALAVALSAGQAIAGPKEDERATNAVRVLNETEKLTVFLVEQNAFHALRLAHRGYVMVNGQITMSGTGKELLARPEVRAAYLEGGH